jgi:hypothetical protein
LFLAKASAEIAAVLADVSAKLAALLASAVVSS